ncbi:MAG TPA: hypothetical protein VMC85_20875 [Desulfomonilaceae bacterium]|nr:hypothetical protein [Desulfomonilaceae bacterium]
MTKKRKVICAHCGRCLKPDQGNGWMHSSTGRYGCTKDGKKRRSYHDQYTGTMAEPKKGKQQ